MISFHCQKYFIVHVSFFSLFMSDLFKGKPFYLSMELIGVTGNGEEFELQFKLFVILLTFN